MKWLLKYRKSKGMTQQAVADATNIKRASYSNIENGRREPSVVVAKRISNVLDFDWTCFFTKQLLEEKSVEQQD